MIRKVWPLVVAAIALGIDAYVLAGPLLSGRLTRRNTAGAILVALGEFNLGNLITAIAPGVEVFLASRVIAGAGAGILTAVATATAAAMVRAEERGRAMAMVTFGLSTGTVAGVPVGMLIGQSTGWRWTMGLVVLIGVLSMAALAFHARTLPQLDVTASEPAFRVLRSSKTSVGIIAAFLLGVASLGLYTYLLPMAQARGLADWGFALVWAWGIGGVAGSALVGKPLDRYGAKPFLIALPALLAVSFAAAWLLSSPIAWLIAVAVWGAAGWTSVPTVQQALTADRPRQAMPIIAFQMAAMYLGSAIGSSLLTAGTDAADLAAWALLPALLALALTAWIAFARLRRPTAPARTSEDCTAAC